MHTRGHERTPSGNGKTPLIAFILIYSIYMQHLSLTGGKFRPCPYQERSPEF